MAAPSDERPSRRAANEQQTSSPKSIGRREFVKRTGGLAVVGGAAEACGSTDVVVVSYGTAQITINGLSQGAPSAGSVLVTSAVGAFDPLQIELPSPTAVAQVPSGTYHVAYSPPAGYAVAPSSPSELDITVSPSATVQLVFELVSGAALLRFTVSGLDPGAASGGNANVLRTDIGGQTPFNVVIPATGTVDRAVGVGTYQVTYTPPSGHQMAGGGSNQANVTVGAGGIGAVGFGVEPALGGTLHFAVSGLGGSASSGGTASILRVDIPGQAAVPANIAANGLADVALAVGTYQVTYAAPSGYQAQAGSVNPRTLGITANNQTDFQITVDPLPPPPDLVFHSDWSNSVGTDNASILDGGRWNAYIGNGRQSQVLASTGLDFPSANVLLVAVNAQGQGQIPRFNGIPVPLVGGSLYYRWYIRVVAPNGLSDTSTHPFQDGQAIGSCNWAFLVLTDEVDVWKPSFEFDATPANAWPNGWYGRNIDLQKNTTYRFEMQLHRISATHFNFHVRIYNSAGTLLYDDADITNSSGQGTLASNPALALNNAASLGGLNAGINGVAGPPGATAMFYQGAVAIRTNDWCGPYAGGV